jgi:hypothetical protein
MSIQEDPKFCTDKFEAYPLKAKIAILEDPKPFMNFYEVIPEDNNNYDAELEDATLQLTISFLQIPPP